VEVVVEVEEHEVEQRGCPSEELVDFPWRCHPTGGTMAEVLEVALQPIL
jgi:hypothetical protein